MNRTIILVSVAVTFLASCSTNVEYKELIKKNEMLEARLAALETSNHSNKDSARNVNSISTDNRLTQERGLKLSIWLLDEKEIDRIPNALSVRTEYDESGDFTLGVLGKYDSTE